MKAFYTAKNYSGEAKSGEAEVKNERELVNQLRSDGFVLTSFRELEEEKMSGTKIKLSDRLFGISLKDKLMFTRNLSVMVSSGLPLSKSVKNLEIQTKNKRFAKVLDDIFNDIEAGSTFAEGLAKYPAIFDDLFVNMIKVGEMSGNLEEILDILAMQLEKEHSLSSKIRGAMIYPAVILVAMIGVAVVMLTYILPQLTSVFADMNTQLPASTKFVIFLSNSLINHYIIISSMAASLIVFLFIFLRTQAGKQTMSFLLIHFPLVSNLVIKINCARFARIYSSLLKSGVSVIEALRIVSNTLTNFYYKREIAAAIEKVQKGVNLSQVTAQNKRIFPELLTQMIEVGEETGRTETVLLKLAEFYEGEVDQITKNMSSIIEPVLMIIMGTAVGFFAISMFQPMYSMYSNIN